jgi:hypothetical protein
MKSAYDKKKIGEEFWFRTRNAFFADNTGAAKATCTCTYVSFIT